MTATNGRSGSTPPPGQEAPEAARQAVAEALAAAARADLPLGTPPATDQHTATATAEGANSLPISAPWSRFSAGMLQDARRPNMVETLEGVAPGLRAVELELEHLITTPVKLIADIASHTLSAGGKRLRPVLTLLCAQLCGGEEAQLDPRVVTCAASVELTHTTTLLHDDVIDAATTRRGRPSANLIWGNETSVLVGDYLFAQVFVTATRRGLADLMSPLAEATAEMCAGELLETQTRSYLHLTEKQYRDIISLKTASLTECSCRLGARAVEAPKEQIEQVAAYGRNLGMAFQIADDVLDIVTTEERLGKPVGHDLREGAITLPTLRALQVCSEADKEILHSMVGRSEVPADELQRALDIIRATDAVDYSLGVAREYVAAAHAALESFPAVPARAMLHGIADYVLTRES